MAKYGAGIENIDIESLKRHNVALGYTPGVNSISVAEQTLCFMVGLSRNLFFSNFQMKKGNWEKNGGKLISGKTIGIIGLGHIGKEVARLLKPFQCKILVHDTVKQTDYYKSNGLIEASLEDIYKKADIITLHVTLDKQTHHMINEKSLQMMGHDTFLINTSRGGLVDTEILKKALKEKWIAGAAIDVFEKEPSDDTELLSLPNIFTTPHIGGNAYETTMAMGRSAVKHLKDYFIETQED